MRLQILDELAPAKRIREVESLMEIDQEVAIFTDPFPCLDAIPMNLVDPLTAVINAAPSETGRVHAIRAVPRFDHRAGPLFDTRSFAGRPRSPRRESCSRRPAAADAAGRIALAVIARKPAQHRVDRQPQSLSFDVPKR